MKLIKSVGLIVAMLSAPFAAQSESLSDTIDNKIFNFISEYQISAEEFENLTDELEDIKTERFEQLQSNTEWWIYNTATALQEDFTGTYNEFLSEVAYQQTKNLSKIHYQTNSWTGQARIRLLNKDGTIFNKDWIYANYLDNPATYVSDLIVGLAEESFQEGYSSGWNDGFSEGYEIGYIDGYVAGYEDGVLSTQ